MAQKNYTLIKGRNLSKRGLYFVVGLLTLSIVYGAYNWLKGPRLERPKTAAHYSSNYSDLYKGTITLKDGSKAFLVPVKKSQEHFRHLHSIHQEPSCAAMMTGGKPWPEKSSRNNQLLYALSWELFHDLKKVGATSTKPLTLGFLLFDERGILLGDVGIQTQEEHADEIFFNTLPTARRKGVAFESGKYLIKFYEKHFGKKPMGANILPHNKPSQNLMKKLGFKALKKADGTPEVKVSHGRDFALWERPVSHKFKDA